MKFSRTAWIAIGVTVGIVVIGGLYLTTRSGETQEFVLETVERGDLLQTVDATGELQSIDDVDLSFETAGTVEDVFVSVGEEVEVGDVIATLDSDELEAAVRAAEQAYGVAKANLDLKIAGASAESVAVTSADVAVAQTALQAAKTDLANTITAQANAVSSAIIDLQKAETDLTNTQISTDQDVEDAKNDYMNALKSAMITVRSALAEADEVLGIENTNINDDFEIYLGALNSNAINSAEKYFRLAAAERDVVEPAVFALSTASTEGEVENMAASVSSVVELTSLTLLYTRQTLDATTVNTADFTTTDLLALKTSIDSARASIQSESTLIAPQQAYENAVIDAGTALDNAESTLSSKQQAYNTAVANEASLVSAAEVLVALREADLTRAEAALDQLLATPRNVDLAGLQADVSRTLADLDRARAQLLNAQIVSPIDGVLTDFTLEVGEQATSGVAVATVQSTDDMFQVTVNVAESDIAKIEGNDEAEIILDAFGDDFPLYGHVSTIDPAEKTIEGVIYYEVVVFLNEEAYVLDLKPGMSADVEMTTATRSGVLFVSQRAVLENDNREKYVRVPRGLEFEERLVTTGLRANGGKVEILGGLEEGDKIILTIR